MSSFAKLKGVVDSLAKQTVPSHNPIQLAAISNYKLAQLTFAPPDLNSLRKTAVIKNMLTDIYTTTPAEWLQQMTRWVYFTPESLENMTQEGLEEMFAQYSQTIEAFRPVPTMSYPYNDLYDEEEDEEEDDGQGDDLWLAEDEQDELPLTPPPAVPIHTVDQSPILFSQPNTAIVETESTVTLPPAVVVTEEKPLPYNPVAAQSQPQTQLQQQQQQQQQPQIQIQPLQQQSQQPLQQQNQLQPPSQQDQSSIKQARRTSGFGNNKSINRLSWTSDTGLTPSIVSQNLANEIMSLFDMDFSIDINLNTAPKLPELPFKPKRRSVQQQQQRQSMDMLSSLIPAFDKIALENSSEFNDSPFSQLFPPPPSNVPLAEQKTRSTNTTTLKSVPQRSSSLRNRQPTVTTTRLYDNNNNNNNNNNGPTSPLTPESPDTASQKRTLTRISSLVSHPNNNGSKKPYRVEMPNSPEPSPVNEMANPIFYNTYQHNNYNSNDDDNNRKISTSSTESSDWSLSSSFDDIQEAGATENKRPKKPSKPLPEPPSMDDNTRKGYRLTKHAKKKKRRSVMESTLSKRRSIQNENDIKENKFIKIGKPTKKQMRRVSSSANVKAGDSIQANFPYHTSADLLENNASVESLGLGSQGSGNNFVKRMTSFNWRIKSKHKTVQV